MEVVKDGKRRFRHKQREKNERRIENEKVEWFSDYHP
jgi:hypothetical protein